MSIRLFQVTVDSVAEHKDYLKILKITAVLTQMSAVASPF